MSVNLDELDISEAKKNDNKQALKYFEKLRSIRLDCFGGETRLYTKFPYIEIKIGENASIVIIK